VRSGLERVLLQSGRTRIRDLPDVPTGFEFIQRTADPVRARSILNAWNALNAVGRPLATTPGTPAARVQFLREALQKSLHDPGLLTTSEESNRPIDYATGEEVRELIREATHMPEDIETLFIRAIRGEI
jgi:tripartite-type tricarboxylate transporter receptor subunit TctC